MEFSFDSENGIIIDDVTGERCLIFPKARIEQIFSGLTALFQSGAQVIISEAFKTAAEWYVNELPKNLKADKAEVLKKAVLRFTEGGIGKIEIVEFHAKKGFLKFRIWNNLFAEMRNDEKTYCNLVEAYVGSLYKQLMCETPKILKTACIDKGDAYCEWEITPDDGGETTT
jgi:predicted hydrocarbon binding protein